MKQRLLVFFIIAVVIGLACAPSRKMANNAAIQTVAEDTPMDSVDYFNDKYSITRLIGQKELDGKWIVTRMFLAQKESPEKLDDVTLSFADSSFAGNTPCNSIAGNLVIKGTHVKFTNIVATKIACARLAQEETFLQLLQNSVSLLTLREDRLLLRDMAGRNVFECVKER